MRRLYLKIYLAFLGIVLAFVALLTVLWVVGDHGPRGREFLLGSASALEMLLPPPDASTQETKQRLERVAAAAGASLALFAADGSPLASVGSALPRPDFQRAESHWFHRRGPTVALRLADGRWVVVRIERRGPQRFEWLGSVALLALVVAAGAYPVARGITRRLENLTDRMDDLAAGDLRARATVEGKDEVALLAERFNVAAERIEGLVAAQRNLLAGTSHELRSPLARLRMAAELLGEQGDPKLREQMARDIGDLDAAVGELLAVSRLDLLDATEQHESVDFLALVAEEAARFGAELQGERACVRGDPRSLRHLVRNLLANARRHAPDSPVDVSVEALDAGGALLLVADRGPGVPEPDRERIFQPFARGAAASFETGVGLGLAIVQQVARHHGGEARVFDREGGGSCFEVTLPGR